MEKYNSPEYVRTSLAAAISLGIENGSFSKGVHLTGLNILLTYEEGCAGRCAYCGVTQRKITSGPSKKTFIRVKWPTCHIDEILQRLQDTASFERICISMVTHGRAFDDTVYLTEKIKSRSGLPISLLIAPTVLKRKEYIEQFKKSGAEMIGVAIDGATERVFNKYRAKGVNGPHKWDKYWEVLKWSIDVFGKYMAGIHLICGLGETEEEMVQTIYRAYSMGAKTHLFSFYPEANTLLAENPPPPLLSYRKIQIARYLINEMNWGIEGFIFNENGQLCSFNGDISFLLSDGAAFMTSGCPCRNSNLAACNRPFANERPSEVIRNYPHLPDEEQKSKIRNQIKELLLQPVIFT
ncbi:MAG: radical SAM protein [Actinobacteria bacterium]|nr:radical SAM protein [Actinomycetota bacterium]